MKLRLGKKAKEGKRREMKERKGMIGLELG